MKKKHTGLTGRSFIISGNARVYAARITADLRRDFEQQGLSNDATDPSGFIKRIEVRKRAERYSCKAPQEIRIYYRDISLVDELPQSMAEAEEIPEEVA